MADILRDRKFREGFRRLRSRELERRLAAAKREFNAHHPERERERDIERAKRHRPHPFLVVPANGSDQGERPLQPSLGLHNASVEVVELGPSGEPPGAVAFVEAGKSYQIRCRVTNLGKAPALMGIAEFFVAAPSAFDAAAAQPGATLPALGYGGFSLPAGKSAAVVCPRPWVPTEAQSVLASVLVQVYDPTGDFVARRFNALQDRHVGRLDLSAAPEFLGTWRGGYLGPVGKEPEIQVTLQQTGQKVSADMAFSSGQAVKAAGEVEGQQAVLKSGALLPGLPQSTSTWTLSFLTPSTLRLQHDLVKQDGAKDFGTADLERIG